MRGGASARRNRSSSRFSLRLRRAVVVDHATQASGEDGKHAERRVLYETTHFERRVRLRDTHAIRNGTRSA
jgi:hypothetical protein